jgi:hypothetical protein
MASIKKSTLKEGEKMVNGKVMVPRKKLQSVPDLLANGAKEEGEL